MSFLLGVALLVFLFPVSYLIIKKSRTKSVTVTNMYITISFLLSGYFILLYCGVICYVLKPEMLTFTGGVLVAIFVNTIFKVIYGLK